MEVISPTAGGLVPRQAGLTVKVRAANANGAIKRVAIAIWDHSRGNLGTFQEATHVEDDLYELKFAELDCRSQCRVAASITDDQAVETFSAPIDFVVTTPPLVFLSFQEGQQAIQLGDGAVLERAPQMNLSATAISPFDLTKAIVKVVFYANGEVICNDISKERFGFMGSARCDVARLAPGKYKLFAVATDAGGTEGKSTPIEVVIR